MFDGITTTVSTFKIFPLNNPVVDERIALTDDNRLIYRVGFGRRNYAEDLSSGPILLTHEPTGAPDVAVMASPNTIAWNVEVQDKLIATGFFSSVDVFDIQFVTPTLAEMQSYDALLVYTNGAGFADATTFGNNLADYVDGGGGVVTAVFATASIPILGRFNSDNYWAIQPSSQQQGTQEGLGTIFDPNSPILNGVTSFNGGSSSYRPFVDNLHPSAARIANWTGAGNIPLIATRVIDRICRVDLGFFPPSNDSRSDFWDATTDGDLTAANALLTVMFEDCIPSPDLAFMCEDGPPEGAIVGTEGPDMIEGTDDDDVIYGLGGNDKIDGMGGDDLICAGIGDDRVKGGEGFDDIDGEEGDDRIDGGPDDDLLIGGPGFDRLDGAEGTDECLEGEKIKACEVVEKNLLEHVQNN